MHQTAISPAKNVHLDPQGRSEPIMQPAEPKIQYQRIGRLTFSNVDKGEPWHNHLMEKQEFQINVTQTNQGIQHGVTAFTIAVAGFHCFTQIYPLPGSFS